MSKNKELQKKCKKRNKKRKKRRIQMGKTNGKPAQTKKLRTKTSRKIKYLTLPLNLPTDQVCQAGQEKRGEEARVTRKSPSDLCQQ